MGNYYTRTVRVYPKSKKTNLDIKTISENIVNTALLDYEMNAYENIEENCLDLCWRSKRAGGELGIDLNLVDVWELRGGNYTRVFFNGKLLGRREYDGLFFFRFDEIEFSGDILNEEEFFLDIFPYVNSNNRLPIKKEGNISKIKIAGIYRADCDYEIGVKQNKINYLSKEEFLTPKGKTNLLDGCLSNEYKINSLIEIVRKFHQFERSLKQDEILYEGLDYFQLNFKNRPVVQIKRNDGSHWHPWIYNSSNWWDNCILPEWIEYITKRNTHDNNR